MFYEACVDAMLLISDTVDFGAGPKMLALKAATHQLSARQDSLIVYSA